jgi:ceramide glucosyltransferase
VTAADAVDHSGTISLGERGERVPLSVENMAQILTYIATYILLGLFACSLGYGLIAIARVLLFRRTISNAPLATGDRPVTVIKPICGMEVELAENLRSFCNQDYGDYQILFGVRSAADPAIPVVEAIIAEFPDHDISLIVSERIIGSNYKISNIANIAEQAKHDILVISDSDMRVERHYLKAVIAPFSREDIGATTCLYSGHASGGTASIVAAMFVNDWFLPSALIPQGFAEQKYCFGATMAVRRDVLNKAGGFSALANFLADDYMLGKIVTDAGYRIALVPHVVANVMHEESWQSVYQHELRWARTIRSVQPVGYALSAITEILPLSILAGAALWFAGQPLLSAAAPIILALALRTILHGAVCASLVNGKSCAPWLIPVRDTLSLMVRVSGYFGSRVMWRENAFTVLDDNRIEIADEQIAAREISSQRA